MIKLENVSFEYESGLKTIDNVSFTINKGESVGLIGANGAGKSTLLKILLGLLQYNGKAYVDDLEINKENINEIRKKLGYLLQNSDHQMFMPTVYEDMIFAPLNYGLTRVEADQRVDEVLKELNLENLKNKYNHKISGGEKRMAAIATILVMNPDVLLMDEPTIALDPRNRRNIINTINKLNNTKLIASHDLDMILETCDRVILINNGKIIADGKTSDILSNKELLENNYMELPMSLNR